MTVRARLALVVFLTGLLTAVGVMVTVGVAFQRLEHERSYDRASAFLDRVLATYDDVLALRERNPDTFEDWLRSLLLFEPDTQLYLLDPDGQVLARTGRAAQPADLRVALGPVRQAAAAGAQGRRAPYVMGDDPEHMNHDAVVAARALRPATIRPDAGVAGYLYVVVQPAPAGGVGPLDRVRSALLGPALAGALSVVAVATLAALWLVAAITRPLRALSDAVDEAARLGFRDEPPPAASRHALQGRPDEFGRLHDGFQSLMAALRRQWQALLALDGFRRESVSNLSHDLRSPLTATAAALETLQQRWSADPARADDRALLDVALRNTRNAARLVRSLGDLARLDEPGFRLELLRVDLAEALDDIGMRFAERARAQGVALHIDLPPEGEAAAVATVDVELFERAVANLLDNAFKFTPPGGHIQLRVRQEGGVEDERAAVAVTVQDTGCGIAEKDQPHLFERYVQARADTAPAGSDGGMGLGLAIVHRIMALHGGSVGLKSAPGQGTAVTLRWPRAPTAPGPALSGPVAPP